MTLDLTSSMAAPSGAMLEKVPTRDAISDAVAAATAAIAPSWPLKHFVAVNPFLGLTSLRFGEAAQRLQRVAGARLTMPREFYLAAVREGRIGRDHLEASLASARADRTATSRRHDVPPHVDALLEHCRRDAGATNRLVPTVADSVDTMTGETWGALATDRISAWGASYFDEGQASWKSPWRHLPPFGAWRAEALVDRTPEIMGCRGFRAAVDRLPATAAETIVHALQRLRVPADVLELYLHRLLMSIGGWASYARYLQWESERRDESDETLQELLAIRLGWEVALLDAFEGVDGAWRAALASLAAEEATSDASAELAIDLVLHDAYERAWQARFIAQCSPDAGQDITGEDSRPRAQVAFCIDVRSEVIRRALESVAPDVETIGFAGFFGAAIEYVPLGEEHGGARCPVLLRPQLVVAESVRGASNEETHRVGALRMVRRRARRAWKAFKQGAVSCFGFVGPVGLLYARQLVTDSLGVTRPAPHPSRDGIAPSLHERLGPTLERVELGGRTAGIPPEARLAIAEGALKGMSLGERLARVVLLAGHGSTSVNNPHASGLDCGACGGHSGEANARIVAEILNDPDVRAGLAARGRSIPSDTLFIAGLHDTTTDDVTVFHSGPIPETHVADVERLLGELGLAAVAVRGERAQRLGITPGVRADEFIARRSRDWSQVRPEWGLAGCAAFVAAPRRHTAGIDLDGRAFLHSYDWRADSGFEVLQLIMTAPMIVASWISLQYFGSTVDNRVFGSGNKTLHNVVGTLGVLEGNGGDLRVGLPWQSLHDGVRLMHEPVRLNAMIAAPLEAMNAVIASSAEVRALVDNGWLHLWAMDDAGRIAHRYVGDLRWQAVDAARQTRAA